jgi:hypothetical protein
MNNEAALWIAIASGALALLGALGSQIINAIVNLRTKRLELVYSRKADSYREFMQKAAAFWNDPANTKHYSQFIHIFFATTIVASNKVVDALSPNKKDGVYKICTALHTTPINVELYTLKKNELANILEQATTAMRRDLQRFSRH